MIKDEEVKKKEILHMSKSIADVQNLVNQQKLENFIDQQNENSLKSIRTQKRPITDTIFLKRSLQGGYHAIYIETNKSSKEYKTLANFSGGSNYKMRINEDLAEQKNYILTSE
ncbi:MAG: hypothetical protein ACK4K0_03445 [Flavobacteriales bacterium]